MYNIPIIKTVQMLPFLKKLIPSNQMQVNISGAVVLALLVGSAWYEARHFTWFSALPLVLIAYAAFRIVFELTFNRANVPTLATGFIGRRKIADILRQEVARRGKDNYTVIDLGSGRGELTRYIAKTISNARVIGIENARIPCMQSAFVQRWLGPENLSYQCCDFWPYDCSEIDAVVLFLTPTVAIHVGEKLYRELRQGSMVISHTFPLLGAWTPIETLTLHVPFEETIYVYRKE
jgi:SAM-dependent methyltransferase